MQKEYILRDQRDFVIVYNKGKSQGSRHVVVLYRPNRREYNRVAFLASKKVGNSVKRNRARRLMRESFREIERDLLSGYDIIFVARNGIDAASQKDVFKSMKSAVARASLYNKDRRR